MKIDVENLPEDVESLHQMIADLSYEVLSLKDQLALLKRKRFGQSSEKLDQQIAQLELQLEDETKDIPESEIKEEASEAPAKEKNKPIRKPFPEHLPREEITLNPAPKCPDCDGDQFRKISDDVTETLDYVPSSFKVIRTVRPRCACINCEKIVQAEVPSKPIPRGTAESGLLAHILVQKYCNHLPYYRQSEIYARENVELSRNTMASWAAQCSKLLTPLIDELKSYVFSAEQIHGDDTTVKVLAPGAGKTKTGRIWSYVRDGRAFGDDAAPAVCYYYSPDRKGKRPAEHLKNYSGILHADSYAGYKKLYRSNKNLDATIEEAACWAHARRKFYEITVTGNNPPIATETLEKISKIYKVEALVRGLGPEQRVAERQRISKPIIHELLAFWKQKYKELPKKSSTAKAIYYALRNEQALLRFLENGKIEIDNNAAERSMRVIALGRKNWMFAGSDNGGHTAASIYSLLESAKLNGINPHEYLKKILTVIQDHNSQKIQELLPWNITL
jgi:transposase